jgi:hypothetical protein
MSLCSNPVGKNAAGNDVSVGLLVSRHRPARSMLTNRDDEEDEDEDAGSSAAETDSPPSEEEQTKPDDDAADTMGRKLL